MAYLRQNVLRWQIRDFPNSHLSSKTPLSLTPLMWRKQPKSAPQVAAPAPSRRLFLFVEFRCQVGKEIVLQGAADEHERVGVDVWCVCAATATATVTHRRTARSAMPLLVHTDFTDSTDVFHGCQLITRNQVLRIQLRE